MSPTRNPVRRAARAGSAAVILALALGLAQACGGGKDEDPPTDPGAMTGGAMAGQLPAQTPPQAPPQAPPQTPPSAGMTPSGTAGTPVAVPSAGASAGGATGASGVGAAGNASAAGAAAGMGATAGDSGASAGAGGATGTAGSAPADSGAADPSAGCMGGTIKAGHTNETIQVGGSSRQYVQHIPNSYDGKKPFAVLLDFHGGTYDGPRWDARASNKFKAMSETEQFLYLSPTGLNAWWTTTDGAEGADGKFMRALIDKLKKDACVDTRRIYSTGCSMGGDMSFYMACYLSDVIAASLPMCGTMSFELAECKPTRPISVRFIMGSRDSLNCWEPPRTSVGNPCASEVLEKFKMLNSCTDTAEMTHNGLCRTYDQCAGGTEASICKLDATHTGIYQATDMDVYAEGWKFLKSFVLPKK